MTRVLEAISLTGANPLLIFPNGCSFDTNDVFVGSGRLHTLQVTAANPIGAIPNTLLQLVVYDCLNASTGRIAQGGTTTQETYRLAIGTHSLGAYGEPTAEVAFPADVLTLKAVVQQLVQLSPETPNMLIPVEHDFVAGMVVALTNIVGAGPGIACSVKASYTPWVSGGTRRRRVYPVATAVDATTKRVSGARTNISL